MPAFRQTLLNEEFAVTAELPLHPAQSVQEILGEIEILAAAVDALQIGDNEKAEGHIAPLAAAQLALERGIEPIVHLSCRDRNRIALQSDILGAAAIGATTLLLWRGNKLPSSLRGRVKSVFDTKATQLLASAARLRDMSPIESAKELFFGTVVTVFPPETDWRAEGVIEKIDAGAGFLQTRPCLDAGVLAAWVQKLVALKITHRATLIVGVPLLTSALDARNLVDRYPDALIPEDVMRRLAATDDGRKEGIDILAAFLRELMVMPGVGGATVYYQADAQAVVEAIERARATVTT